LHRMIARDPLEDVIEEFVVEMPLSTGPAGRILLEGLRGQQIPCIVIAAGLPGDEQRLPFGGQHPDPALENRDARRILQSLDVETRSEVLDPSGRGYDFE